MPTILIADDHKIFRQGLRALLDSLKDMKVVGEAGDGTEALQAVLELLPDIAIIDIAMPGLDGLELIRKLKEKMTITKVIVLTMHSDERILKEAMLSGASGFVLKQNAFEDLAYAIDVVMNGNIFISPAITDKFLLDKWKDKLIFLSDRQKEILKLIAFGFSNKEIADKLNISVKTVETHRARIMEKLGIHRLSELVRYAVKLGVIS